MDAIAPAALALSVSLDAVANLGLALMSYEGPFVRAMLPMTPDVRLNIAAGVCVCVPWGSVVTDGGVRCSCCCCCCLVC